MEHLVQMHLIMQLNLGSQTENICTVQSALYCTECTVLYRVHCAIQSALCCTECTVLYQEHCAVQSALYCIQCIVLYTECTLLDHTH